MKMNETVNKPAMAYKDVDAALSTAQLDPQVSAAIIITWLCAGRVGDSTLFHKEDFVFSPISDATQFQKLRIIVRRGKAARLAQPHTIYTICPPQWRTRLMEYLDRFEPTAPLFNRGTDRDWAKLRTAITAALRTSNKEFGHRALRRGALQTLAADPSVDLATLRTFSGHTNDEMLLRYLNWGLEASKLQVAGQRAATNLAGPARGSMRRQLQEQQAEADSTDSEQDEEETEHSGSNSCHQRA